MKGKFHQIQDDTAAPRHIHALQFLQIQLGLNRVVIHIVQELRCIEADGVIDPETGSEDQRPAFPHPLHQGTGLFHAEPGHPEPADRDHVQRIQAGAVFRKSVRIQRERPGTHLSVIYGHAVEIIQCFRMVREDTDKQLRCDRVDVQAEPLFQDGSSVPVVQADHDLFCPASQRDGHGEFFDSSALNKHGIVVGITASVGLPCPDLHGSVQVLRRAVLKLQSHRKITPGFRAVFISVSCVQGDAPGKRRDLSPLRGRLLRHLRRLRGRSRKSGKQ